MELDFETCIDEDDVDEFSAFKSVLQGTHIWGFSCVFARP